MSDSNNKLFMNSAMLQYSSVLNQSSQNISKLNDFKERIVAFNNVSTLEEAKELATKILPTSNEINHFYIGEAKCTIVNSENTFRICLDSPEEFLCYNFE